MLDTQRICAGLFVTAVCGHTVSLHAQNYPARPLRLIIPFSPGGATDVPGRILAQKLSEVLGQQVVVDNRPGAGSTIGTDLVAKTIGRRRVVDDLAIEHLEGDGPLHEEMFGLVNRPHAADAE